MTLANVLGPMGQLVAKINVQVNGICTGRLFVNS